ncbi:MAG: T9SS type A sorting domain-containing protein [Saprospiraceae bacterium]|nr:T9SS type A sorting domain-containing protein [Saprospiraceae bacterium]
MVIAGFYEGTVDFDPGTGTFNSSADGFDGFILKLDVNGDLIWFRAIEGVEDQAIFSMELGNDGSVYLTGYYSNTTDFDPSGNQSLASAKSGDDPFVLKLDKDGSFEWVYAFGADGNLDGGNKIAVGDDGSVGVIGNYEGTIDFPTPSGMKTVDGRGSDDTFILKLDKDGNYEWSYDVGGESRDYGQAVDIDKNGNLYFGGYTLSDDFVIDTNGENVQKSFPEFTRNAFLIKYNADGSFNKQYAHQAESLTDMTLDGEGNLYVCGAFDDEGYIGNPELDLTPPHLEFDDIYFLKLTEDLDPVESGSIVGLGEDLALDIEISDDNEVYLTGWFKSDIRPNTNDPSEIIETDDFDGDVYVVKLSSMSSSVVNLNVETSEMKIFPNPVDDFLDLSQLQISKTARVRILNSSGQLVIERSLGNGRIDLSLSSGSYYLHILDETQSYTGKFIKV